MPNYAIKKKKSRPSFCAPPLFVGLHQFACLLGPNIQGDAQPKTNRNLWGKEQEREVNRVGTASGSYDTVSAEC